MKISELKEITNNTYKWIKVPKYTGIEYPSPLNNLDEVDWESEYRDLNDHHIRETNFLIDKCKQLASELIKLKEKDC